MLSFYIVLLKMVETHFAKVSLQGAKIVIGFSMLKPAVVLDGKVYPRSTYHAYMLATISVGKVENLPFFSQNHTSGYLKNHWTNTRLVCTHLNPFFMLNPNMTIKIWILKFFEKSLKISICRLHSTFAWRGLEFCNCVPVGRSGTGKLDYYHSIVWWRNTAGVDIIGETAKFCGCFTSSSSFKIHVSFIVKYCW